MRPAWHLGLLLATACSSPGDDLEDGRLVLPELLREVSGIVAVDERTLACVQDEAGAVCFVDVRGEVRPRLVAFGAPGDYEGIAYTGAELWVLRSDGALMRLAARGDRLTVAATVHLPSGLEYEGLCHDAGRHRLLVMPKGPISDKKRERDLRRVFAFDLDRGLVLAEPVLTVDLDVMVEQATERGYALPTKVSKKGRRRVVLELMGSEIAVVPGSEDWLLLSSVDHLLVRVDPDGNVTGTRMLDAERLPQPEAMTFLPDGRLIVASESRGGPAVAMVVELP